MFFFFPPEIRGHVSFLCLRDAVSRPRTGRLHLLNLPPTLRSMEPLQRWSARVHQGVFSFLRGDASGMQQRQAAFGSFATKCGVLRKAHSAWSCGFDPTSYAHASMVKLLHPR